jgi:rSAM/selenodomain-associated transferase 1
VWRPLPAVAIFSRAVLPGATKTRLIPLLGAPGAAKFHAALISDTLRKVNRIGKHARRHFFLAGRAFPPSLTGYIRQRQRGKDLGARLERAFQFLFRRHNTAVIIGTDSPELPSGLLVQALRELRSCDAVLGPCPDGGYYLIGLRRQEGRKLHGLFRDVRWGSSFAFRHTLESFLRRGFICSILEPFADVDGPADFHRLRRSLERSSAARRSAPAVWRFMKQFRPAGKSATLVGRERGRRED